MRLRAAALAAAAVIVPCAAACASTPATYRARFTETRTLAAVKQPLVLHGNVEFRPGQRLVWAIDKPYRYRLVVHDGRLAEHLPDGTVHKHPLSKTPWAQALFDLFSALFGGDSSALSRYFHVDRTADGFTLVPRSEVLAHTVKHIAVTGRPLPDTVTIVEADGSRTRLAFQATSPLPPAATAAAAATGG